MSNNRETPLYRLMFEALDSRRGLRSLYTAAFQRALPDAVLLFERVRMATGDKVIKIDKLVAELETTMGKQAAKTYIDHRKSIHFCSYSFGASRVWYQSIGSPNILWTWDVHVSISKRLNFLCMILMAHLYWHLSWHSNELNFLFLICFQISLIMSISSISVISSFSYFLYVSLHVWFGLCSSFLDFKLYL